MSEGLVEMSCFPHVLPKHMWLTSCTGPSDGPGVLSRAARYQVMSHSPKEPLG